MKQIAINGLGILGYSEDELVSADIVDDEHSGIIEANATRVIMDRTVKVLSWYDNDTDILNGCSIWPIT